MSGHPDSGSAVGRRLRPIDILLVEDSATDAYETRRTLKDCKIWNRLRVVRDGVDALACLRGESGFDSGPPPDLVLLDLGLPLMDGREVLDNIRKDPDQNLSKVPVVILSGSEQDSDIVSSYEHRVDGFLTKPLDLSKLYRVIFTIRQFGMAVVVEGPTSVVEEAGAARRGA